MNIYFSILENNNIHLSFEQKMEIIYYAGRFPYLLCIFGDFLIQRNDCSITDYFLSQFRTFTNFFDNLLSLIEEDNSLEDLVKLLVGPQYNLKKENIINLKSQNYITEETGGYGIESLEKSIKKYISISEYFTDIYLRFKEDLQTKIWPILTTTEKLLRTLIKMQLEKNFKDGWEKTIWSLNDDIFVHHKAESYLKRTKEKYGKYPSNGVLDVLAIGELSNIIQFYWSNFMNKVFQDMNVTDLVNKLKLLNKARNPLAHANDELLTEEEINLTTYYCKELQPILEKRVLNK
jgi:hypothetical protein